MKSLDNWLADNSKYYTRGNKSCEVKPCDASKFINIINDPNAVYAIDYSVPGRVLRYKNLSAFNKDNNTTHTIDINNDAREVSFRVHNRGCVEHVVVGTDADFKTIVDIINKKMVQKEEIGPWTVDRQMMVTISDIYHVSKQGYDYIMILEPSQSIESIAHRLGYTVAEGAHEFSYPDDSRTIFIYKFYDDTSWTLKPKIRKENINSTNTLKILDDNVDSLNWALK